MTQPLALRIEESKKMLLFIARCEHGAIEEVPLGSELLQQQDLLGAEVMSKIESLPVNISLAWEAARQLSIAVLFENV